MEKKDYIIVSDDNTWCSTLRSVTENELKEDIDFLKKQNPEFTGEYFAYPTVLSDVKLF